MTMNILESFLLRLVKISRLGQKMTRFAKIFRVETLNPYQLWALEIVFLGVPHLLAGLPLFFLNVIAN
jgi:hypothetical protein